MNEKTKAESNRLGDLLEGARVFSNEKDRNSWFVPILETKRILDNDALRVLFETRSRPVEPGNSVNMEKAIQKAQKKFLLAFATLIYCSESAIATLGRACDTLMRGETPDIPTDLDLPLGEEDAKKYFGKHGLECQNRFCAIILNEGSHLNVSNKAVHVPFVGARTPVNDDAEGSAGKLYKVKIARGHYKKDSLSPNDVEKEIAQKVFNSEEKFEKELRNLRELQNAQTRNNNVMGHLVSLQTQGECSIFYTLAECDLERYLHHSAYNDRAPNGVLKMTLSLMTKATHLVGGLAWLHHPRPGHSMYHFDIKPNNILVVKESGWETWKLHDFDLSHPKERSVSSETEDEFSSERISLGPRTFRAPEMFDDGKAGHKSDVWSIACILLLVFCFSDGGPDAVNDFDNDRRRKLPKHMNSKLVDFFYDYQGDPGVFHGIYSKVQEKIDLLKHSARARSEPESDFVSKILAYIVDKVLVAKDNRVGSKELYDTMSHALGKLEMATDQWYRKVSVSPGETAQPRSPEPYPATKGSLGPSKSSMSVVSSPVHSHQDTSGDELLARNITSQTSDSTKKCSQLCRVIRGRREWEKTTLEARCVQLERLLLGKDRQSINLPCQNCEEPPLISAARTQRSERLLETLLGVEGTPKIDLEVQSPRGLTALLWCCKGNFLPGAVVLLKAGANFDKTRYQSLQEVTPDFRRKFKPDNKSFKKKYGLR